MFQCVRALASMVYLLWGLKVLGMRVLGLGLNGLGCRKARRHGIYMQNMQLHLHTP